MMLPATLPVLRLDDLLALGSGQPASSSQPRSSCWRLLPTHTQPQQLPQPHQQQQLPTYTEPQQLPQPHQQQQLPIHTEPQQLSPPPPQQQPQRLRRLPPNLSQLRVSDDGGATQVGTWRDVGRLDHEAVARASPLLLLLRTMSCPAVLTTTTTSSSSSSSESCFGSSRDGLHRHDAAGRKGTLHSEDHPDRIGHLNAGGRQAGSAAPVCNPQEGPCNHQEGPCNPQVGPCNSEEEGRGLYTVGATRAGSTTPVQGRKQPARPPTTSHQEGLPVAADGLPTPTTQPRVASICTTGQAQPPPSLAVLAPPHRALGMPGGPSLGPAGGLNLGHAGGPSLGLAVDVPWTMWAAPQAIPGQPASSAAGHGPVVEDHVFEPLDKHYGTVRRALGVSSMRLQEAVRIALEVARRQQLQPAGAQSMATPGQAEPPELEARLRTLNVAQLSAELSGLMVLGRGGNGLVCRAVWQGIPVAVKFMGGVTPACVGALEGVLATAANHPNIVQTYGFDVTHVTEGSFLQPEVDRPAFSSTAMACIVQDLRRERAGMQGRWSVGAGGGTTTSAEGSFLDPSHPEQVLHGGNPGGPPRYFSSDDGYGEPPELQTPTHSLTVPQVLNALGVQPGTCLTHIIMELCDRGDLLTSLQHGVFRVGGVAQDNAQFHARVVLRAALRTARDVARGMQHLHALGIIHGDLKPGNILLQGSRTDRRGFVAKIADLGLGKVVSGDEVSVEMHHWSTATHMAPEVIKGTWCKQSDVYSFGILLWQLVSGDPAPFKGLTVQQVLLTTVQGRVPLEWPTTCHTAVARFGNACLAFEARLRPTFQEIGDVLAQIEQNMREELRGN